MLIKIKTECSNFVDSKLSLFYHIHASLYTMKKIVLTLLIASVALLNTAFAQAQEMQTTAKQAIIIDYDTGNVLYEKNADERMPTSSMSKVMTIYMVFDALKKGNLKLDDTLAVSEKAWKTQGSKMFVPIHEQIKVEDLIRGVIIQSGNDATIVLAEGLSGSEESFAAAMNKKAEEIGMKNSHFMNASGWPDDNHYSTARDLSIMAANIIKDFPEYISYYSEKEFTYHGIKQGNRNPLLYRNIGADGLKTGHTDAGGYGLIGTGKGTDGRRVIVVLNGMSGMQERADESARLLQWGITGFKNVHLFEEKPEIVKAPVVMGQRKEIALTSEKPVIVTLPKMAESDVKVSVNYKSPLIAPIAQGQEVGNITVKIPNAPDIVVPLVASEKVEELSYFMKLLEKAKYLLSSDKEA